MRGRASGRIRCIAAAALGAAIASGCSGYHFVRASQSLGDVRRVAVKTLANDSYQPGLELMVTEALRREMQRRGATLVQDPAQADLVLEGTVRELGLSSRSFSSIAFTLEYQIDLKLDLTARRADGSRVEIDSSALQESELYLTSSDIEAEFKNRDEALRRLSAQLASRVHDSLANRLTAR
jgi:hypothetical protein